MDLLAGYDDIDTSGWDDDATFGLGDGEHFVTITKAAHQQGEKNGLTWNALFVTVQTSDGTEDTIGMFLPTQAKWQKWKPMARTLFKKNWQALGIDPRHVADEPARAAIIDRKLYLTVATQGKYKNYTFRVERASKEGAGVPTAEQRTAEMSEPIGDGITI